jgi:hypothetical protein
MRSAIAVHKKIIYAAPRHLCRAYAPAGAPVSISYGLPRSYGAYRRAAPSSGRTTMALLHLHHQDISGFAREQNSPISRAFRRIVAALGTLHRAIISAKLRHAESDLLLRSDYNEMLWMESEQDVSKFPQRPTVLGDKWDF